MNFLAIPEVQALFRTVIDPGVKFIFGLAVFYFVYGIFTYINRGDDSSERIQGANHILWSTIGLFIMVSVWGIVAILEKSIGVTR